jgi:hypothetical protein
LRPFFVSIIMNESMSDGAPPNGLWEVSSIIELLHGGAPALELCFLGMEPCHTGC